MILKEILVDKKISTYLLTIFGISFIISLVVNIFDFNLRSFISFLLKSIIFLHIVFSVIINIIYKIKQIKLDEFYDKILILDTLFFSILVAFHKWGLL